MKHLFMRRMILLLFLIIEGTGIWGISAQHSTLEGGVSVASPYSEVFPFTDRILLFNLSDSGLYKPIIWGLDLAWLSEDNIRRGIAFMGEERVDVVRSSFMPVLPLNNGELQGEAFRNTNLRISIINRWLPGSTTVALNCDHPSVHSWYAGNAVHWAQLMDVTARMHQEAGRRVVSISPFNEPDYGWGQGDIGDFYNIAAELRKNARFDSIRISGGNTLNCDQALSWYNILQSRLDEGNTHQLAGSFDNYAAFFQHVRTIGDHATNDELHNVMEAMVGVEYGLQTGIWWGTAEYARGEFVKASDGRRLGYAEHRPNWTAAAVYRNPEGKVQGFCGSSERQAVTTSYSFLSRDRDVFYDGHGPQRQFVVEIPGGTGYQQGQTNAERVIGITWGDDIQPVINGKYLVVNRNSGKVLEVEGGSSSAGANVRQGISTAAAHQQWSVTPVDARVGGDFSYFTIKSASSGRALDVYNWSLNNGGNIVIWDDTKGGNQQWFTEYAGDGWFYIRSRHSALCLDVLNASTANGANVIQREKQDAHSQHWRLIPVTAPVEFIPPEAPANLRATARPESVRLDWDASPEEDVAGYAVFRSESMEGPYNTIARDVKTTAFVDNTCTETGQFFYKVNAVDHSLNCSACSNVAVASTTGDSALVAHFRFNGNTLDSSINLNHGATPGEMSYVDGADGSLALALNGNDDFMQLPATVANQEEITLSAWVYWNGGTPWQRIFDFSSSETEYMNLTPRMRFSIRNGGSEQRLDAGAIPQNEWSHVAVSLGRKGARMYLNGTLANESAAITLRPVDFRPFLNFIGRGQAAVPLFNGSVDDFKIHNYQLSDGEIMELYQEVITNAAIGKRNPKTAFSVYPVPASDFLHYAFDQESFCGVAKIELFNAFGELIWFLEKYDGHPGVVNVSDIPAGVCFLRLTNGREIYTKKIIISH